LREQQLEVRMRRLRRHVEPAPDVRVAHRLEHRVAVARPQRAQENDAVGERLVELQWHYGGLFSHNWHGPATVFSVT
jgi:hypothetical protein